MDAQQLWIAQCLSDIFSEVDARPELPLTAWHILEEGLSRQAVESLWYDHLRPALEDGLEGYGSVEADWLAERLTKAAPRTAMSRWWTRVTVPSDPAERQFQAMLQCHEMIGGFPKADWAAAARVSHDLVEIFLDVSGGRTDIYREHFTPEQIEQLAQGVRRAFRSLLPPREHAAARLRLEEALYRLTNRA